MRMCQYKTAPILSKQTTDTCLWIAKASNITSTSTNITMTIITVVILLIIIIDILLISQCADKILKYKLYNYE